MNKCSTSHVVNEKQVRSSAVLQMLGKGVKQTCCQYMVVNIDNPINRKARRAVAAFKRKQKEG